MVRIVFADSEPHLRQLFREELLEEGYDVEVAGEGGEVVRLVDSFHPDVVILEVLLPDMSGLDTVRIIKGTEKATRIILYSNFKPPRNPALFGADAYVVKSPNPDRLKEAVRRLLPN